MATEGYELHKSISNTFAWTYIDLTEDENDLVQLGAFILLTIIAPLGTSSVNKVTIIEGLKLLYKDKQKQEEFMDKSTSIIDAYEGVFPVIEWLLESSNNVEKCIDELNELALLDIHDADECEYALHPLIREFAFDIVQNKFIEGTELNKTSFYKNYLIPQELILKMAINLLSNSDSISNMLDLLPRIKSNPNLAELALNNVKRCIYDLYFSWKDNSWILYKDLLTESISVAEDCGFIEYQVLFKVKLGELLDRMSYSEGRDLIKEGIYLYVNENSTDLLKESKKKLQFNSSEKPLMLDWLIESKADNHVTWSVGFLEDFSTNDIYSEENVNHGLQLARLFISQNNYSMLMKNIEAIGFFSTTNYNFKTQITFVFDDTAILSNVLRELLNWVNESLDCMPAENIFSEADYYYKRILHYDKNSLTQKKQLKLSLQSKLTYELTILELKYYYEVVSNSEFEEQNKTIRNNYTKGGIRLFFLEINQLLLKTKISIKNQDFIKALEFIQYAKSNLSKNNHRKSKHLEIYTSLYFILINVLLKIDIEESKNNLKIIYQKFSYQGRFWHIPLYYLCKAAIANVENMLTEQYRYTYYAEHYFCQLSGAVPLFARPILSKLKSWRIQNYQLTEQSSLSWIVDPDKLPKKVINKVDNKEMILVSPSMFPTQLLSQLTISPFYIDQDPLSTEDICKTLSFTEESKIDVEDDQLGRPVQIANFYLKEYLRVSGKRLPNKSELMLLYTSEVKEESEYQEISEILDTWKNQLDDYLYNIEKKEYELIDKPENSNISKTEEDKQSFNLLKNKKTMDQDNKDFDQFYMSSEKITETLNEINSIAPDVQQEFITAHFNGDWFSKNKTLNDGLEAFLKSKNIKTPKLEFTQKLITSLSLSSIEKERIILTYDKLSEFQITELFGTFDMEFIKFFQIERDNYPALIKMIRSVQENVTNHFNKYIDPLEDTQQENKTTLGEIEECKDRESEPFPDAEEASSQNDKLNTNKSNSSNKLPEPSIHDSENMDFEDLETVISESFANKMINAISQLQVSIAQIDDTVEKQLQSLTQQIEYHFSSQWIKDTISLKKHILDFSANYIEKEVLHTQHCMELVLATFSTISLTLNEKLRIIKSYSKLSDFQKTELYKIYKEEQTKFINLEDEHFSQLKDLIDKSRKDVLRFFRVVNVSFSNSHSNWHLLIDKKAHSDAWLEFKADSDEDIETTVLDCKTGITSKHVQYQIRTIKPIFTMSDMQGLKAIE